MKQRILLATTNPSKAMNFKELLGDDYEYLTLRDFDIEECPEEAGNTPLENAIIKAKYYGEYFDFVISADSGLFFDDIDMNDSRQPKTHVRRIGDKVLNDEEMINYYSSLAKELGGKVLGYYIDAYAISYHKDIYSVCDLDLCKRSGFYLIDKPSPNRHPGWPLDSLSIGLSSGRYFVDEYDFALKTIKFNETQRQIKEIIMKLHD